MILVLTSKRDGHINGVGNHFDAAHVPWVRVNTEDFAKNVRININPTDGTGFIRVLDSNHNFALKSISAVWYRKPDPVDLSHFLLDKASLEYVEAEFNETLQGIYALLSRTLWINNPLTSRLAHRKMLQLLVARSVGLSTPPTIITNSIQNALEFAESVKWDIAIKSLGAVTVTSHRGDSETQYGMFTRRIGKEELITLQDKIPYMPTLFQQYIDKEYELRVTCVGEQIFPCRIYSQNKEVTSEDYRFDTRNLQHELCAIPEIAHKLLAYMKAFKLNFGCFDIIFSKSGEFIFLECNPNGQWLWIEQLTGAPISKAVADMLISGTNK